VFLHSPWASPSIYSDVASFWGRDWVASGQVPFSSGAFFEYPPLSGVVLYASRIIGGAVGGNFGGAYAGYYVGFSTLSLIAGLALAWSTWRLARGLGVDVDPFYFLLPSMIVYGVYNFDLFNALFIVLSLQFFVERRSNLSGVFLGLSMATKLVGIVLLPVFLLELPTWNSRIRYLAFSLLSAGIFFVPIAVYDPGYFGQFFSYYSHWGLEDAWYIWIFNDQFSIAAKAFGGVLLLALLLRVYTLKVPLAPKALLALAAYLLATYIYAPQFNITLIPLFAVLAIGSPWLVTLEVFNALIILTWFSFPNPTHAWTVPQAIALIRSASLGALGVSVASGLGHSPLNWLRGRIHQVSSST
jgi:hypothetical protein